MLSAVYLENSLFLTQLNRETLAKRSLARWVGDTTEVILDVDDVNVIQVDWVRGASVDYDQATSNTRLIGAQIGHLVKMLMVRRNFSLICRV